MYLLCIITQINICSSYHCIQEVEILSEYFQQVFCFILWTVYATVTTVFTSPWCTIIFIGLLPTVYAFPDQKPFPSITFKVFSKFIDNNFSSDISLATVLSILFTLTNNPDLLNLHARQQQSLVDGENIQIVTGWMRALAHALEERLHKDVGTLFQASEQTPLYPDQGSNRIALKLDGLAKLLGMNSFSKTGQYQQKLKSISHTEIE